MTAIPVEAEPPVEAEEAAVPLPVAVPARRNELAIIQAQQTAYHPSYVWTDMSFLYQSRPDQKMSCRDLEQSHDTKKIIEIQIHPHIEPILCS